MSNNKCTENWMIYFRYDGSVDSIYIANTIMYYEKICDLEIFNWYICIYYIL